MKYSDSAAPAHSTALESPQFVAERFRYFTPWLLLFTALGLVIYVACFPHPAELAARNWPLILIGVCGALIGNITAIGGGLVFIPVLTLAYHVDPLSALKLTFVTQAVGMTSGASGWLRRRTVPLRLLRYTVPALLAGALISCFVLPANPVLVKGLFGPICLVAGVLILVTADRKGGQPDLPPRANWLVAIVSLLGGLITGWVAIGEGEIIAAFCMLAYNLDANRAVGLGVVLLSINSIALALIHGLIIGGIPWNMAIFTMLGVLWGGRLGPYVAQWLPSKGAKRLFASIAILDGALVFLQAIGFLARLKGR
jgi:uncharacterized membrane protein YfcA